MAEIRASAAVTNTEAVSGKKGPDSVVFGYVMSVFRVFASEACDMGKTGKWQIDKVRSEVSKFLSSLADFATWRYSSNFDDPCLIVRPFREVLSSGQARIEATDEWKKYQEDLLEVGRVQAGPPFKAVAWDRHVWPDEKPLFEATPTIAGSQAEKGEKGSADESDSLQGHRRQLLMEYKAATGNPANQKIYKAKNSCIHKPEFYDYLNGKFSSASTTCINFERFLREKKPPIPRKNKA